MLLETGLQEFVLNCQCRNLSPKTISNYQKQIQYLFNYLSEQYQVTELEDVKANQIKKFLLEKQKQGRKPQYINDLLKAYKCFFRYMHEEEYTDTCITDSVKNMKQPKVIIQTFSNDEVKRMINYYSGRDYLSVRNKTIMFMLFDTGIRLNELITLTLDQIRDNYIIIYGKGNKERVVPKSPFLAKCLIKYIPVRSGYFTDKVMRYNNVFLSKNGKPLTHEAVEHLIRQLGVQCNVDVNVRCSPHTCRHTYAQMQLKNGLDIYSLCKWYV